MDEMTRCASATWSHAGDGADAGRNQVTACFIFLNHQCRHSSMQHRGADLLRRMTVRRVQLAQENEGERALRIVMLAGGRRAVRLRVRATGRCGGEEIRSWLANGRRRWDAVCALGGRLKLAQALAPAGQVLLALGEVLFAVRDILTPRGYSCARLLRFLHVDHPLSGGRNPKFGEGRQGLFKLSTRFALVAFERIELRALRVELRFDARVKRR
jgi:hypothetical protein